jgi:hypothetical protein
LVDRKAVAKGGYSAAVWVIRSADMSVGWKATMADYLAATTVITWEKTMAGMKVSGKGTGKAVY